METLTFTFLVIIGVMAVLIAWSYTKPGKKWLKNL